MNQTLEWDMGGGRRFDWTPVSRFVLYLTIGLFFLQRDYFGIDGQIQNPGQAVVALGIAFGLNLGIMFAARNRGWREQGRILTFIVDLILMTGLVLASGGFGSALLTSYIPILIIAPAWLPRRHSAIFPSIAVLGVAYIGLAHFLTSLGETFLTSIYPARALRLLRHMEPPAIVIIMLVLTILFFTVSYFAGMLGNRYFTLRQRMETAERNVEHFAAISTMAAGLAHEIRNPLASLRSAIQEIGDFFPEGNPYRVLSSVVISESDRLDKVIERFLDFSREGKLRLSRQRLGATLREVRTLLLRDGNARDFRFELDIRGDPEVTCDADRLKEVFFNLALNAAQITAPKRNGVLTVTLAPAEKGGMAGVEIVFVDNGPGIGEYVAGHLFQPFFTTRAGGSGMGLSLSRKQVNLHGGEIDAGNNPGGGARFRVWVPLEQTGR